MSGIYRTFGLAALLSLLLGTYVLAGAAAPVELSAAADGETVTVTATATQAITLSNYDLWFSWDASAFTLREITNGQEALFRNFQSNTGDGRISAMSRGNNVTVPAGETLVVYTLSAVPGTVGDHTFTLTVRDAANEDGDALAWKGESVRATVTLEPPRPAEISALTVSGGVASASVYAPDPGYALFAAYDGDGRLLSVARKATAGEEETGVSFPVASGAGMVKLFLVDASGAPMCAARGAEP